MSDTKLHEYRALCDERRHAAFSMVGCVSALLHLSLTLHEPFDKAALQAALDKYEAADKALGAFKWGERNENPQQSTTPNSPILDKGISQ